MFSEKFPIKKAMKNFIRDWELAIQYYAYKDVLPKNPMHDDIYLVEFPKSGITWLQHILGNIELQLLKKNEFITFYNHHKYLPDVHQLRNASVNRFLKRTFIKSHSNYNPYYYFVIYLIRNPFDVMVSYYNFHISLGFCGTFMDFIKSPSLGIKAWAKHVESWFYKRVDAQRILFFRYEDIINEPKTTIKILYKNLGISIEYGIIEKAIELSSLKNMKFNEEIYREQNPNYNMFFIGKDGKKRKDELMTKDTEEYIYNHSKCLLEKFYNNIKER